MSKRKPKIPKATEAAPQPEPQQAAEKPDNATQAPPKLDFRQTVNRVRHAANRGNPQAVWAIKECVKNSPNLCAEFGDPASHVERALIEQISGGEVLTSAAIAQQAAMMRRELAGAAPTRLEAMAIQRIVITWLALQNAELRFQQSQADLGWAKYWLRRLETADKLYRAAIGSLTLIRTMLPAAQPAILQAAAIPATAAPAGDGRANGFHGASHELWYNGVNRLAGLVSAPDEDHVPDAATVGKLNGFRGRLEGLLVPSGS